MLQGKSRSIPRLFIPWAHAWPSASQVWFPHGIHRSRPRIDWDGLVPRVPGASGNSAAPTGAYSHGFSILFLVVFGTMEYFARRPWPRCRGFNSTCHLQDLDFGAPELRVQTRRV